MLPQKTLARCLTVLLAAAILLVPTRPARADIAPPQSPPGANLAPGEETTRVRMLAETVTLEIISSPAEGSLGQAAVTALFSMQNLGDSPESMAARFPLTFWDGASDGFGRHPEVQNLKVWVDGRSVSTRRVSTPGQWDDGQLVPWAAFDVTFPPGQEVRIKVTYIADAYGEYPFAAYRYILETGAGWQGSIGSADLIVRLPYDATPENVLLNEATGFSETSPGAEISGREVRWHTTDLEPTAQDNLQITLLMPPAWRKIQRERENTINNPRDGEAWGRLGKACKEAIEYRRGLRQDAGGQALYAESVLAYQTSLELLPRDSLWHTGYADLLWQHYFWDLHWGSTDFSLLAVAVEHLKTAVELDPRNGLALDLLEEIRQSMDAVVEQRPDGGYDYLILTATPFYTPYPTIPPVASPTPEPAMPTATQPVPTAAATATALTQEAPQAALATAAPADPAAATPTVAPDPAEPPRLPICGGAAAVLIPLAGVVMQRSARRRV